MKQLKEETSMAVNISGEMLVAKYSRNVECLPTDYLTEKEKTYLCGEDLTNGINLVVLLTCKTKQTFCKLNATKKF